ncbi:OmpL47-type beta-barrel domain-containing protein [Umezawaea beigongshangensis]|uniref:OmpL47-type beta-barrel domain-containing protein n=1 Tax=Umezawaea beigongshangensis TaxID=2780383 RepID=UPI0018F12D62|nr:copper-binding protein [Umezawaea beigongshangensis]
MFRRLITGAAAALLLASLTAVVPLPAPPTASAGVLAQVLTWTADNDITRYKSAPTTATAGETTIVWENSEATGNTTGMPHTLTFDTSTPGYNHDVDLDVLANPFDVQNGRHEAVVALTPGKYRYFCAIPGHGTMSGEFTVTSGGGGEDTTAPTVAAAVSGPQDANGDHLGSATVTVTASDSGSGVASVEHGIDGGEFQPYTGPFQVTALGEHTVRYRATDAAGNASEVGSVSFTVVEAPGDTTPPTVTAAVSGTQDASGAYVGRATVTITATDTGSGVKTVEHQLDGGPWTSYTAPFDVTTTGSHMIHHRATDNAGNVSAEGMTHFSVVAAQPADTTPPTVTAAVSGTQDATGAYVGRATVTITATDTGSGVKTVEHQLDGGPWTSYTAPFDVTTTGSHAIHHRATDNAGNVSAEGTTRFSVVAAQPADTTPPTTSATVSGSRNPNGDYLDSATVTITATDTGSGVTLVEHALDGGAWTTHSAALVVGAAGPHTVRYRATDDAGNTAAEKSVSFAVVDAGEDACPDSDTRDTVIIGTDDTGIANAHTGNGCTISDLLNQHGEYPDHGAFVRHVELVTDDLVASEVLTRREQGVVVRAASRSDIGK